MKIIKGILTLYIALMVNNLFAKSIGELSDREGYVILRVVVNGESPRFNNIPTGIKSIDVKGAKRQTIEGIYQGQNSYLVKLPAGKYEWSKLFLSNGVMDLEDSKFEFDVIANKINYGGDLLIDIVGGYQTRLDYANRASFARTFMEREYQELLQQFDMVYTGLSRDSYFDFVNTLHKKGDN